MVIEMAGGYGTHAELARLTARNRWLGPLLRAVYPPMPTLNTMSTQKIAAVRHALFAPGNAVIDIGGGAHSGCGRRLWIGADLSQCQVYNLDLLPGEGVGVVGNAELLPFSDDSVDALVMQAVLEHLPQPTVVLEEATRVLKPGGYIYIEMPFLQGYHADPEDFQRYTLDGLRQRLSAFEEIDAGVSVGPFCTFVWFLRDGFSNLFRQRWLYLGTRFVAGWALSPLRYLDYCVRNRPMFSRLANEFYILGRKRISSEGSGT